MRTTLRPRRDILLMTQLRTKSRLISLRRGVSLQLQIKTKNGLSALSRETGQRNTITLSGILRLNRSRTRITRLTNVSLTYRGINRLRNLIFYGLSLSRGGIRLFLFYLRWTVI